MVLLGGSAFEKFLGHEGRSLMNGISALMKKTPRELSPLFLHVRTQPSMNQSGPSQSTEFAGTLILDFSAPRMVKNKILLFKSPNPWYFVIGAGVDQEHTYKRDRHTDSSFTGVN